MIVILSLRKWLITKQNKTNNNRNPQKKKNPENLKNKQTKNALLE